MLRVQTPTRSCRTRLHCGRRLLELGGGGRGAALDQRDVRATELALLKQPPHARSAPCHIPAGAQSSGREDAKDLLVRHENIPTLIASDWSFMRSDARRKRLTSTETHTRRDDP
eukprot:1187778-Prorocentrum_minimum.AAC.1